MFWLSRWKHDEGDTAWSLSYGDLMSLLLAVFVMIASMSELKAGQRYDRVRASVQEAFGFAPSADADRAGLYGLRRPMTLIERLHEAGLTAGDQEAASTGPLELCDLAMADDRLTIRVSGPASFEAFSATLQQRAERTLEQLAGYLSEGESPIEIQGHAGDGALPGDVPFRDAFDLSYQRAHAAAAVLTRAGVDATRIRLIALGDTQPILEHAGIGLPAGTNRRIELVVGTRRAATIEGDIAGKD